MNALPESISKVFGSTERARKALQRSNLPDDMIDHTMSALHVYVYLWAEIGSTAASSDIENIASAATHDACPAEMRQVFDGLPTMPRTDSGFAPASMGHRDKAPHRWFALNACMARPVNGNERMPTPAAQAAMTKEWDRLRAQNVLNEV